jgi:hypothetical protein
MVSFAVLAVETLDFGHFCTNRSRFGASAAPISSEI